MTLSILICTLPERYNFLKRLTSILDPQVAKFPGEIEIVIHDAGRSMTTGEKRNWLISHSSGEYFSFIDDDDQVMEYYCEEMMKAIQSKPDVVSFRGFMTTDGRARKNFIIRLHEGYYETKDMYYRYPNHLCAMRRDKVGHISFPHITQQEDFQWATLINKRNLLKSEVFIDKDMYWYEFRSRK